MLDSPKAQAVVAAEGFSAKADPKWQAWVGKAEAMLGWLVQGNLPAAAVAYDAFASGTSVEVYVARALWTCSDIERLDAAHTIAWNNARLDHRILIINRLKALGAITAQRHADRRSEIERDYDEEAEAMACSVVELVRGYQI